MIGIISNWIFIWFILFIFNLIPRNPFWILVIAYIITLSEIFYLFLKNTNNYNLIKFFIINVCLKFIPILIILIKMNFKIPKFDLKDFKFGGIIIVIYIITLIIVNENPFITYKQIFSTYIKDDNKYRSYISKLYDDIYNFGYLGRTRL